MALSSNFVQQVKADTDIVRIIGEHLRLRKSRSWKGRSKKTGVRIGQPRYNIFGGGGAAAALLAARSGAEPVSPSAP
jgi:hypothetical protein